MSDEKTNEAGATETAVDGAEAAGAPVGDDASTAGHPIDAMLSAIRGLEDVGEHAIAAGLSRLHSVLTEARAAAAAFEHDIHLPEGLHGPVQWLRGGK